MVWNLQTQAEILLERSPLILRNAGPFLQGCFQSELMGSQCCELLKWEPVFPAAWGAAAAPRASACVLVRLSRPFQEQDNIAPVLGWTHPGLLFLRTLTLRRENLSKRSSSLDGHSLSGPLACQPVQNCGHDTINPAIYIALNSANIFSNTKAGLF